jgi:curved DNA-binding protein CbpA
VNLYDVLQVSPLADEVVIRAAYRSLMQRYHPDRHPGDLQAAEIAARITQAYEVLSDPIQKAAYDASLQPKQALPSSAPRSAKSTSYVSPQSGQNQPAGVLIWLLRGAALLACLVFVGFGWRMFSFEGFSASPHKQLEDIRLQMAHPQTTEAERKKLFASKQNLLDKNADLMLKDSTERVNDLADRSVALLAQPLVLSVALAPGAQSSFVQLSIPEISLVLGSFDHIKLQAQILKHRERIVQDLGQRLSSMPEGFGQHADIESKLRRLVRDSVMQSMDIKFDEAYPSTYFESPGRYGVVDVSLPKSFLLK